MPKYKQQLVQYADFRNVDNYRAAGDFAIPIVKMCEEWLIEYKGAEKYPKYLLNLATSMSAQGDIDGAVNLSARAIFEASGCLRFRPEKVLKFFLDAARGASTCPLGRCPSFSDDKKW